jgi:hypothetical protein
MSVKLLENTSFNILRVNPKLSTNVKLVVDTKGGLFLESFDANEELSKSKYKAFRVSSSTKYEYDLARFYKDTPTDVIFQVQRDASDLSVLKDFGKQYEMNYMLGAESVNSVSYSEEFGILAPIWLEKNIPDYFVVFRIEEPVSVNNIDAPDENANQSLVNDPNNFIENILKKAKIIKTFDLSLNSEAGKYIRHYRNSERFPEAPLLFNFERNEPTYWNGIDLHEGGFTSKPEFIYDNFFAKDTTILEDEFFITQGFERNSIACANIMNMFFLFDDKDVKEFTINRYFGLYVNALNEGTFQVSGKELYMDSFYENQVPKPKDENYLVKDNTADLIQKNEDGIVIYIDKDSVDSVYEPGDTDNNTSIDLKEYHFLPKDSDVSSLVSLFYVQDKNLDFYNLKINSTWNHGTELRLKSEVINWKNFTGVEEPILTTLSRVSEVPGKASTFLRVNSTVPHGDKYFTGLVKKQIYRFIPETIIPGDTFTITDNVSVSISVNAVTNNVNNLLDALKTAWKNETFGKFPNYSVSVKDGALVVSEKSFSGADVNFTTSVSGPSSEFNVIKDVSADLEGFTITADGMSNIPAGTANGRFFCPTGTNKEIAKAMTAAFNNIKDGFFEATNVDNLVILVAKNAGNRFNDLSIGRDLFFTGAHVNVISNTPGFTHPDFSTWYYEGGNNEPGSRVFVDIDTFNDFNLPNRFVKTIDKTGKETGLAPVKKVSYYIDEPIKNKDGKIVGYKNIDKFCTIIIHDEEIIFRDSIKYVYLYELFKVPFGRFSIFPIKDMDIDCYSPEYGDERELNIESTYYKEFDITNDITQSEIEDFYDTKEFATLQGLLENENVDSEIVSPKIEIEYDRLNENFIQELSTPSRIAPYINKWVYRNGKDTREHDYRLISSEAFGITNFSPSEDEFTRDPDYFTHEWYYLQKLPFYYGMYDKSLLKDVFSYFPDPLDVTSNGLYNVNSDYFTEYFTVDLLKYPILDTTNEIIMSEELVPVKKQLRYGVFEGGTNVNFSTAFFRGVKAIVKERIESQTVINYNLQNIKFKESNRYNDYKFSAVLIPHSGQYPSGKKRRSVEIEFIENRKFKNITLVIYVRIDDLLNQIKVDVSNVTITQPSAFIDRTILYALDSRFTSINSIDANTDGSMDYEDVLLTGAIDMRLSAGTSFALGNIRGTANVTGELTEFIDELILNKQGSYNIVKAVSGTSTRFFQVTSVKTDDWFTANPITGGPQPIALTNSQVQNGTYTYLGGGYKYWDQRLTKVSYAAIADLVNNGNPDISYHTVLEDGSVVDNLFVIELQTAKPVVKPSYIKSISDNNKPVNFNLTDTIGYQLVVKDRATVQPIYRHSGKYQPKFIDIINFEDPYITETFANDVIRENQIRGFIRDKNTQLKIESNFGLIKNLFYHKISDKNKKGVLELTKNDAYKPLYPLIGEIAIDKKDFYTFASNWDAGYFDRYIGKVNKTPIIGTRSIIEKKSFFGSKIMKILDEIQVETFDPIEATSELELETIGAEILKPDNPYEIVYLNKRGQIIIDIYLEKRLTEVLAAAGIEDYFASYIKPEYGFGLLDSIKDDVTGYIVNNILPRYTIGLVELYVKKTRVNTLNITQPLVNSTIPDTTKNMSGMSQVKDFSYNALTGRSNFNIRIIYNKTKGYYYSVAPSIKIIKK